MGISEVTGLRWRDLAERDGAGQVTVYGKGGKTGGVLLSAGTWTLLASLRGAAGPDEAVFRFRKAGALDASQVHRIVKAAAERAGLSAEVSATGCAMRTRATALTGARRSTSSSRPSGTPRSPPRAAICTPGRPIVQGRDSEDSAGEHLSLALPTSASMTKKKAATTPAGPETIAIDPSEPVHMKDLGGADSDRWNGRLITAIPGSHAPDQRNHIAQAVITGQMALKLTDPVEAMLSAQMIAANAASLDLYRRAWIPEQSFEARTSTRARRQGGPHRRPADRGTGSASRAGAAADHRQARHRQCRPGRRRRRDRRSGSGGGGMEAESQVNLMHWPMHQAPRCTARSKRTGSRAALRPLAAGGCAGCMGPAGCAEGQVQRPLPSRPVHRRDEGGPPPHPRPDKGSPRPRRVPITRIA